MAQRQHTERHRDTHREREREKEKKQDHNITIPQHCNTTTLQHDNTTQHMTEMLIVPRERRVKGPMSCENIGCTEQKAVGRNKCAAHLECQRVYSRKYQRRKREQQQTLKSRINELEHELEQSHKESQHWRTAYERLHAKVTSVGSEDRKKLSR